MYKSGRFFALNSHFFVIFVTYSLGLLFIGKHYGNVCVPNKKDKVALRAEPCPPVQPIQPMQPMQPVLADSPGLVVGIVTKSEASEQRTAIRKILASSYSADIKLTVSFVFIIDSDAEVNQVEKFLYKDIVSLGQQGKINSPSRRLFLWLKYAHEKYPSTLLVAKMEGNAFLCTPHIFHKLGTLQRSKLLYGYRSELNSGSLKFSIHNAFMVIGKTLVERITKRTYCSETHCTPDSVVQKQDETESLGHWLQTYSDIDFQNDKKLVIDADTGNGNRNEKTVVGKDFCEKYLLYYSASYDFSKIQLTAKTVGTAGGVTGHIFSGEIIRDIQHTPTEQSKLVGEDPYSSIKCNKWAVTTTIFSASKSVQNMANRPGVCTVIVADSKTPSREKYLGGLGNNFDKNSVVYLSPEDQNTLYPHISKVTSWKTFGRKNIGYLFAMHHGAKVIWDFDDDNDGIIDTDIVKMDGSFAFGEPCKKYIYPKINPYPYFGVEESFPWPRGFPLQDILNSTYAPKMCRADAGSRLRVGVVQSLANIQPDVDAVYRFTRRTPFNFLTSANSTLPLRIPKNSYTPFNAQATLWNYPTFKYLVLPVSVNGRVADIWRSYFAEFFMFQKDLDLMFAPPYINQYRNVHDYLADFNAENDLYQKSFQLIRHLSNQTLTKDYKDIDDLYFDMYRRGFLNVRDVEYITAWVKTFNALTANH